MTAGQLTTFIAHDSWRVLLFFTQSLAKHGNFFSFSNTNISEGAEYGSFLFHDSWFILSFALRSSP